MYVGVWEWPVTSVIPVANYISISHHNFLNIFFKFFTIDESSDYFRIRVISKGSVVTCVYYVYLRVCMFTWSLYNTSLTIVYSCLFLPHLKIRKINLTFYFGGFQNFPFQIHDLRENTFILRYILMGLSQHL